MELSKASLFQPLSSGKEDLGLDEVMQLRNRLLDSDAAGGVACSIKSGDDALRHRVLWLMEGENPRSMGLDPSDGNSDSLQSTRLCSNFFATLQVPVIDLSHRLKTFCLDTDKV